jgi:hypothetical protein
MGKSSRKLKMCPKRSRLTLKLAEAMQKLTAVDKPLYALSDLLQVVSFHSPRLIARSSSDRVLTFFVQVKRTRS